MITIHWGGFDTHTNQLKSQDAQLKELSRALGAFQADLEGAAGSTDSVATLVFSEFGRRVKETPNSAVNVQDAGTDHGAGGLMLALGTQVKGGLASEWPGCQPADLVPANNPGQGNLKVPTDFRSVYLQRDRRTGWAIQDPVGLIGGGRSRTPGARRREDRVCSSEVARDPAGAGVAWRRPHAEGQDQVHDAHDGGQEEAVQEEDDEEAGDQEAGRRRRRRRRARRARPTRTRRPRRPRRRRPATPGPGGATPTPDADVQAERHPDARRPRPPTRGARRSIWTSGTSAPPTSRWPPGG